MSEEEPTEEELREAEALARALERGTAGAELPGDALEAAALLRYSQDGGALPESRRQAILEDLLADAAAPKENPEPRGALRWLRWLVPLGSLAAAGAVVLLATTLGRQDGASAPMAAEEAAPAPAMEPMPAMAPSPPGESESPGRRVVGDLPPPPASILSHQAAAAGGDGEATRALADAMRGYRGTVYAALEQRYGGHR